MLNNFSSSGSKTSTAQLLFNCALDMGLKPVWLTKDGLFAITIGSLEKYIYFARSSNNSHVSTSLIRNKYLTRLVLERHGIANIPFASPQDANEAEEFLLEHKKIIVKPIQGMGSHDIRIVTSKSQLPKEHYGRYIFERFIDGVEMRYLVLNGKIIAVHQSEYGNSVEADRPLRRISFSRERWDAALSQRAIAITTALGMQFAAVDFLVESKANGGESYVLGVNSTPGLKWFHAPSEGPSVNVARLFLQAFI